MLITFIKELLRGGQGPRVSHDASLAHGIERQKAGDLAGAERAYRDALAGRPDHAEALHLLGNVLKLQGRLDEAVAVLKRAVGREAAPAELHFTLAECLCERGDIAQAEIHHRRAIEINPDFVPAYVNLSNMLRREDRLEEAVECLRAAIRLHPESAEAQHNLGKALYENGRGPEALAPFERAATLAPGDADMRYNYSEALLSAGKLGRGWEEYEFRFEMSHDATPRRPFGQPRWRGEDPAGKTLLVWAEQGIGDEILFAALYEDLVESGARCLFECAPKLVPLFTRSFPGAQVVPRSDPPHPLTAEGIDYQCAAGSVARYLRPTLESFPSRPFLAADEARVQYWRERYAALGPGLKVGFGWRSSNLRGKRVLACTRLEQWGPLFAVPGVHWVCLQYDQCEAELAAARREFGVELHRFGEVDYFDDLAEVAAMMKALDLVISAPTEVSLQAAALGVETWQMSYGPDWQTHGTEGNVWLPRTVRFERRRGETWPEVLETVASRLVARAGSRLERGGGPFPRSL
jgi:tetratricopeptide (TPR) repeat protein